MHSKQKGNIAEAAVILDLKKQGYCVFTELGDLSKIDLIAEKSSKLIRFQVKGVTPNKEGSLHLRFTKSGPGYQFEYTSDMFDYFAVVDLETNNIGYVLSQVINEQNSCCLRVRKPKNNQSKKTKYLWDYKLP